MTRPRSNRPSPGRESTTSGCRDPDRGGVREVRVRTRVGARGPRLPDTETQAWVPHQLPPATTRPSVGNTQTSRSPRVGQDRRQDPASSFTEGRDTCLSRVLPENLFFGESGYRTVPETPVVYRSYLGRGRRRLPSPGVGRGDPTCPATFVLFGRYRLSS